MTAQILSTAEQHCKAQHSTRSTAQHTQQGGADREGSMAAALDVLGYLPGPPTRHNCSAAETLAGELFAYGVASAVAILDVRPSIMPHH